MENFTLTPNDFLEETSTPFNEGRYPYTYACDFIRSHNLSICETMDLPFEENIVNSRAEASGFMKKLNAGDSNYRHIALVFADAFCIEHRITVPEILGFQVNLVGTEYAVGHVFPTHEAALAWTQKNPARTGYYSIDTIFTKD